MKRTRRHDRRGGGRWAGAGAAFLALLILTPAAWAWDSRTHRLITRLAIAALPASPLKSGFVINVTLLEEFSTEPDSVLRPLYGEAEARRHYIDLEYFGADPFANLNQDFATMERRFGAPTLDRAGTLPWAIEAEAAAVATALRAGDCAGLLRHAGYLAHYVGDASQPLHTTRYYDGPTPDDRGMHARLESAVDHRVREIEAAAAGQVRWQPVSSAWDPVIAELKGAHALVGQVVFADRTARAEAGRGRAAYTRDLMALEQDLIVRQVAAAASVLASLWVVEFQQAGSPAACSQNILPPS